MRRIWLSAALMSLSLLASSAGAKEEPSYVERALRLVGKKEARVQVEWTGKPPQSERKARVTVKTSGPGAPLEVHAGKTVRTALAVRQGSLLIAMIHGGAVPMVRLALVDLSAAPKLVTVKVPRPADAERRPASVVATADDQGFTVLWQEESPGDRSADVRTYLTRVTPAGKLGQKPTLVEVPWALAAIAHNGKGYHLALFYDGAQPGQTRLAMVTLSPSGAPEQHPWWASRPTSIADVQLLRAGGKIVAYYRSGADADELESIDVTAVGQWGQEPAAAKSHGRIGSDDVYTVQIGGGGKLTVVRRGDGG